MLIQTQFVTLPVSEGTNMQVYIAMPEGDGPFPGLLVFQEAFGVNAHIRSVVDRFANEGYIAIAPELFHRTAAPGLEIAYTDFASVMPHMQSLTIEDNEADIIATYNWLKNNKGVIEDEISSTGYCMGGRMSFLANSILPLKCAVSYYAGGIAPHAANWAPNLHGPMLCFWGGLDKHILPEQIATVVEEMKKADKQYMNVEISYADHGFFCDAKPAYNPKAAKEAWALTLAFLKG